MRTAAELLLWWLLLTGLYVVLIGPLEALDVAVGAACALGAAVAAGVVRRASSAAWGPGRRAALAVLELPGSVLADTVRLAAATGRRLVRPSGRAPGVFRELTLSPGVGPAWAAVLLSASPGVYVVAIAPSGPSQRARTIIVHALDRAPGRVERALTDGRSR
ncbi:Na+/H+ antiporter subunit E [Yinghuangia seranimata]|uniref:Na+/H+ antiporter subunit E n=1 Tax=Yinghuangia seranimata TaxID=408067 RepID=UPI00248C9AD2|nr:Na+/H+ antiporter subunit E [Yinghuangia seranimata]MDI2125370.1 Na+/H+ antiporter subunit E [Yinghuangia seranimata]